MGKELQLFEIYIDGELVGTGKTVRVSSSWHNGTRVQKMHIRGGKKDGNKL